MKKVFLSVLFVLSLTFMSFNNNSETTDWVPICTGTTTDGTQSTVQLMANSRTGVRMLIKKDRNGNQIGTPVVTTMDKREFKDYCEDNQLTNNC